MILLKQLVQKSIEKFHEAKLSGKEAYKLYYFAYGLSYSFLKHNNSFEIDEKQFQLRNIIYKTLFDDMVKESLSGNVDDIEIRYQRISSRLKKDFQSLIDNDLNVIAKFLDETAYLQSNDESYGVVFFPDDTLGILESNYPE